MPISRQRKLLFIQPHPVYGATERNYLFALAKTINKDLFEKAILFPDVSTLKPFGQIPEVTPIKVPLSVLSGNLIFNIRKVAKAIRGFSPDIVHINDPSPVSILAAKFARVPKILVTHHTPELKVKYNLQGTLAKQLSFQLTDHFIFTSPHSQEVGSDFDGIPQSKSTVIPYGLEKEKFLISSEKKSLNHEKIRKTLNIPQDHDVIASAGRLEPQKAQLDLIQAAKIVCYSHSNITFVLVGEGSLRKQLELEIAHQGLENKFLLPGYVDNVVDFLCTVDIFTMSSLFEGLCYAVLEASAMAIPVVATGVGGMRYSVADEETGLLVEAQKPEQLAEKLNLMLDNQDIAKRMGEKGRKRFLEQFTLERMAADTEYLYWRLMENQ